MSNRNSSGDWSDYPGSRRRTTSTNHATGRSNYGGTRRSNNANNNNNNDNQKGNPIGNWIQNRAREIRARHRNRQRDQVGGAVGTEAKAIKNLQVNAKDFKYPEEGFITPVEHSLLYAMIEFPENYPESVIRNEIEDEDFTQYLYVKEKETKRGEATSYEDDGSDNDVQTQPNNNDSQTATQQSEEDQPVSYGQLSALLALSAAKNPSTASPEKSSSTTEAESDDQTLSVGETLCRKLLRTITRYADANSLDRNHEIREFLDPIERRCAVRNEKAALQQLLPAYAGYTVSLLTGNPLPLLLGAAALTGPDPMMEENTNVHGFRGLGSRTGDMETAGLLDENEFDDD
ncbi:hypothetical protein QTG54_009927 [Skeletonema marinoi]|uniref:Uncharacterized protein n=1 Tax=Skeletonema marinoi TaxID=267567 RepID=A0AAD8Y5G2_9STRA|nr:hypothetical protein QTG54_009927 [Skeletonema marinoi]